MRVALVHELLTMKGGAEQVLRVFAEMFPEAPIYTLLYDEKKLGDWFPPERVRTSKLQKWTHFSFLTSHFFNHHLYLPFFASAAEAWSFEEFDLVISSSSAFAHGIITNGNPKHIYYVHSPARYMWDRTHDVQERMTPLSRAYFSMLAHRLRVWDAESARRADRILAASKEVQRRTELYWNRKSDVVYPPISDDFFTHSSQQGTRNLEPRTHYLVVSTLAPYKRIDLAIEACNKTGAHLKIVGDGRDMERLKKLAGPTIEFYGHLHGKELRDLYSNATATIFPGHEDFGLVPVESMACGTPVIAYRAGGALETVIEGETGTFFNEQTADALAETLKVFDHKKYSKEKCTMHAQKFSKSNFVQQMYANIDEVMKHGA